MKKLFFKCIITSLLYAPLLQGNYFDHLWILLDQKNDDSIENYDKLVDKLVCPFTEIFLETTQSTISQLYRTPEEHELSIQGTLPVVAGMIKEIIIKVCRNRNRPPYDRILEKIAINFETTLETKTRLGRHSNHCTKIYLYHASFILLFFHYFLMNPTLKDKDKVLSLIKRYKKKQEKEPDLNLNFTEEFARALPENINHLGIFRSYAQIMSHIFCQLQDEVGNQDDFMRAVAVFKELMVKENLENTNALNNQVVTTTPLGKLGKLPFGFLNLLQSHPYSLCVGGLASGGICCGASKILDSLTLTNKSTNEKKINKELCLGLTTLTMLTVFAIVYYTDKGLI